MTAFHRVPGNGSKDQRGYFMEHGFPKDGWHNRTCSTLNLFIVRVCGPPSTFSRLALLRTCDRGINRSRLAVAFSSWKVTDGFSLRRLAEVCCRLLQQKRSHVRWGGDPALEERNLRDIPRAVSRVGHAGADKRSVSGVRATASRGAFGPVYGHRGRRAPPPLSRTPPLPPLPPQPTSVLTEMAPCLSLSHILFRDGSSPSCARG